MIHHVEVQVLVLLLIASFVAMGARRLRQPYTLALVAAGLGLGLVQLEPLQGLHLNADLLMLLFLPPLLFEAAFHIDFKAFRRDLIPILILAVFGVLIAVTATTFLLYASLGMTGIAPNFGWEHALLISSVIAATDPISVLALFKEVGVARRLYLLVEGESLLNDGIAVVVFSISATVLGLHLGHGGAVVHLQGAGEIASFGLRTFFWMAGGGVVVGLLVGGAVSALTRQVDDHLIEITLTTLVAFGAFLLAEEVGASGVLSTVTAGIVMGSVGRKYGMSASTRLAVVDHWEYMAFLANSFIFLLVGLELEPAELIANAPSVLIGFFMVLVGRSIVVYGTVPIANRFAKPIPLAWRHIMFWGGLRGSLSMVLILTIPASFAGRSMLVTIVFGVVAASLFGQGLSIGALARRLGLVSGGTGDRTAYEEARGRMLTAHSALETLGKIEKHGRIGKTAHRLLHEWYSERHSKAEGDALESGGDDHLQDELIEAVRQLTDVEQDTVRHASHIGVISRTVAGRLAGELDLRVADLDEAQHHSDEHLKKALDQLLLNKEPDDEAES